LDRNQTDWQKEKSFPIIDKTEFVSQLKHSAGGVFSGSLIFLLIFCTGNDDIVSGFSERASSRQAARTRGISGQDRDCKKKGASFCRSLTKFQPFGLT
jgi:hypothetical protein